MQVLYTGTLDQMSPDQRERFQARINKLAKMIDGKGEKEAHIILNQERHLHTAEITLNYHHHGLAAVAQDGDLYNALSTAMDKLEKQLLRIREKFRDSFRQDRDHFDEMARVEPSPVLRQQDAPPARPQILPYEPVGDSKPMTMEEAVMEMEKGVPYVVYRDSSTQALSVLLRRQDGNFELVTCQ